MLSLCYLYGRTPLLNARNQTRSFYAHKSKVELSCRIDPRIEPLDNVAIPNVGVVKVEKVTLKYNGGFKGSIRGRLVRNMLEDIAKPTVTFDSFSALYWSGYCENKCPFPVTFIFDYNGTEIGRINVGAKENYHLSHVSSIFLQTYITMYNNNALEHDVNVVAHNSDYGADSDDTVVLTANA